jgi:hypothetical protein
MIRKALLFFLLLYVVDELHFKWQTGIPAVAPVNIILVLTFLSTLGGGPDVMDGKEPILKKGIVYFSGALVLAFLWAQIRSFNDVISDLTVLKNAIFYPLFYFVYRRCREGTKTVRWLIIWIMAIAAVAGLEAFREGLDYGFGGYNPYKRASGPFGEDWSMANTAGVFFAMFMPMFVAFALFLKKQIFWRIAAVGGIVLLAAGTLMTYSRQSYFIVLFAATVLLVRKNLVVAIVLGITLVSLSGYLPDAVTQRVEETQQSKDGKEEVDASTASRWEIWAGAMAMWARNPLGVGIDRFKREIGNYSSHKGMDAHNFFVRTLAEYGPHGLVALFLLIRACFGLAKFLRENAHPDDPDDQALAIGFTVSTLCVVLGNLYGSRFLDGAIMAPYWSLCGLLERNVHLKRAERGATEGATGPREPTIEERFPLAALVRRPRSR